MAREKLEFTGALGGTLAGRLDRPEGEPRAFALFAHCFTCGKDVLAAARIAAALNREGIAVLRFDFTGIGSSEGEFANTDFSSNVADLIAAADHLREAHRAPAILIGHSLGGAAVLAAAAQIPEARAVATIAAPADPAHVVGLFEDELETIEEAGEAEVRLAGRSFRIARRFVDDVRGHRLESRIADLRRALLVFHSPFDEAVGIDNATRIFVAAKHPKSFVSLDRADHMLSDADDAEYAARVLATWSSRYIGETEKRAPAPGEIAFPETEPGTVAVVETGRGRFQQAVSMGPHHLLADEPTRHGGDDSGGGPYDLLLAGLGACTAMTVRMYAERKGWPLERVRVRLSHEKVHAEDCASCETEHGRIDRITRRIALAGDLDEARRGKLMEIADRCPVHRTLHGEVEVRTEPMEETG
jgi:putative redox protein